MIVIMIFVLSKTFFWKIFRFSKVFWIRKGKEVMLHLAQALFLLPGHRQTFLTPEEWKETKRKKEFSRFCQQIYSQRMNHEGNSLDEEIAFLTDIYSLQQQFPRETIAMYIALRKQFLEDCKSLEIGPKVALRLLQKKVPFDDEDSRKRYISRLKYEIEQENEKEKNTNKI
eukprot:TRINITY_DN5830_c0_g1_i1.p1 TRINITY_DN5830_c0_g1~~TRINITY_DN5830_c0_g1_i1.p1  ORF type:complete len:171 (-),score=24.09 TRINITY_DN5830_c0_g1_i1:178-690(-)